MTDDSRPGELLIDPGPLSLALGPAPVVEVLSLGHLQLVHHLGELVSAVVNRLLPCGSDRARGCRRGRGPADARHVVKVHAQVRGCRAHRVNAAAQSEAHAGPAKLCPQTTSHPARSRPARSRPAQTPQTAQAAKAAQAAKTDRAAQAAQAAKTA